MALFAVRYACVNEDQGSTAYSWHPYHFTSLAAAVGFAGWIEHKGFADGAEVFDAATGKRPKMEAKPTFDLAGEFLPF